MTDKLWNEAERLAARNYRTDLERDELSNGEMVFLARNPELPGCKAQGATVDEAKTTLDEVRIDYIYALLSQDLPVPEPRPFLGNPHGNMMVVYISYSEGVIETDELTMEKAFDKVVQPEHREFMYGLTLRDDLVEQS